MSQNIYDNGIFFKEYMKIRKGPSFNDLLEQPAMDCLLPNVDNKYVLDAGCGYGKNCLNFAKLNAKKVIGIDISNNMLSLAKENSSHENIEYINMDLNNLSNLDYKFDLVYSSLAFHYIEDFQKLIEDISDLLNPGGYLLFSQEHPITTSTIDLEGHFNKDSNDNFVSYTFSDYFSPGVRSGEWFIPDVKNYHRTFGCLLTTIANAGFKILNVTEPCPSEDNIKINSNLEKYKLTPVFLIIKAQKL